MSDVAAVLPEAWQADSAWIDDWDAANPARGQCGSTALVLQDLCGGSLLSGIVMDRSRMEHVHYWNVVDRDACDLTWQQFRGPARIVTSEPVARAQLLNGPWFTGRYEALRARVDLLITA